MVSQEIGPVTLAPHPSVVAVVRHPDEVVGVAFGPDSRLLATASRDRSAWLWEVASGQERAPPSPTMTRCFGVAFSPDGRLLATASADKTARLWKLDRGGADGTP